MHLGAGQPVPSRKDYWGDALSSLEKYKQSRIKQELLNKEDLISWPDIIAGICRREQDGRQKKERKLRFAGREIDLRKMMDSWTEFLDKIKQIGDVAVNADPIHAGLPWAAVRFILTAVIASKEQNAAIYVGIGRVLVLMNRGAAYELQLAQLDEDLLAASGSFEESLIKLYAQLLDFLASALLVQDKNALERTFYALWTPKDITNFGEQCIELETRLDIESGLIDKRGNRETFENVKILLNATKSLEKTVTDTRALLEALRLEEQEKDDNTYALRWVSTLPVLDHHADARDGRAPGTGQWVFRKPEFVGWDRTPKASFLWIHGIPGAGKTKLVSAVVDHFLRLQEAELESRLDDGTDPDSSSSVPFQTLPPAQSNIALAFFYCRRAKTERRKPENILRSFIKQLAVINDKSLGLLRKKYLEKKRKGFLSNMLGSIEAQNLLTKMIMQNSRTILVLDALDECEEDSRHNLMTVLSELVEKGLRVKVLISSRRDDDITAEFENKDNFNISATDNGEDIMSFVRGKINEYRKSVSRGRRRASSVISDELEQQIIDIFLDKSNGMFQWAAMHITHLLSLHRPSDIAKALPNLPRGLEKTYDEIFVRIMSQEEGLRDIALRTFHWMLSQDGASDLEQLLVAVCQDPDSDEVCPVDLDPDVVLKACQNLVVEEGRYDSTYNPHDVLDRDGLGSIPPYRPNRKSSDFFTYAFSRIPLSLRPWSPDSPPPLGYRHRYRPHDYPLGRLPLLDFPPPPLTNLLGGPPPPPTNWPGGPHPPGFPPPPPTNWRGAPLPPPPPPPPPPPRSPPRSPPPLPPPPPSSPVLRSLHIAPPPSTPSWARPLPPSLFAGQAWTRRRQLRFSHLSVQEYCERLRWTPQVSHCFAAKICLLFLSHPEIQEQAVPDRLSTFSRDGVSWRNDDLRTLPSLELALTNSIFRSVRNFADSFWVYNVQRSCSQMAVCQDKKLIAALANFLGFPGKTSLGFERWLRRFTTKSHIIWNEDTLLPAFWSVNDRRRTAKLDWIPPNKLQFHGESRLVTCFFGLDRILLPSVSDILLTWGTELISWAEEFLSGDACALFFSHMSSIPLLSSMLKQLPEEITTNILWRLVNSVKTHRLEHIYRSSFLDYSTLCLNLAELIHLLQDSNRDDMYGEIVCSLLYPGFSQPSSFVSDGRLWKLVKKLLARGANIGLPFRAALLAQEWHDMVQLIECGFNPGTDSLALILAESPYTRNSPPLDLCHALVDQGADVNANYRDSRYESWHITPLIAACIRGEPALISWLLSVRANVNTKPMRKNHNRILHASYSDGQASGDFQLQKADSPSRNTELKPVGIHSRPKEDSVSEKIWYSTPLIEACARGHEEICEALIAAGANVNAVMKPYIGRFGTALVAACAHTNQDISWILLDDPTIDITMATWRILRARPSNLKSLDSLYVPVYTNPLVTAASSGFHNICRELIERGADVNAVPLDKTGEFHTEGTALIKASACSHLAVCKLLVKHGADVNIVVPEAAHYPTALFAAAMHDRLPAVKWLLSQGAEINKLLLSRFPDFCDWILDSMDTMADDDEIIPPRLFAKESDNDTEDTDEVSSIGVNDAEGHGMISAELASRLFSLGILVNRDAISSEGSIQSTEPLSALERGSELSDGIPKRASQQAGSVNQRVIFGFLTEVILGKHGNETRSYNLSALCRATLLLILVGMSARALDTLYWQRSTGPEKS